MNAASAAREMEDRRWEMDPHKPPAALSRGAGACGDVDLNLKALQGQRL